MGFNLTQKTLFWIELVLDLDPLLSPKSSGYQKARETIICEAPAIDPPYRSVVQVQFVGNPAPVATLHCLCGNLSRSLGHLSKNLLNVGFLFRFGLR